MFSPVRARARSSALVGVRACPRARAPGFLLRLERSRSCAHTRVPGIAHRSPARSPAPPAHAFRTLATHAPLCTACMPA